MDLPSTQPYLVRAIYEWCCDNGFTPYLAVAVNAQTRVPMEFVKDGQIVLNISPEATNRLLMGNDYIEFQARFGGVAREISVPVSRVLAVFARENGKGMAFDLEETSQEVLDELDGDDTLTTVPQPSSSQVAENSSPPDEPSPPPRPKLQRIK